MHLMGSREIGHSPCSSSSMRARWDLLSLPCLRCLLFLPPALALHSSRLTPGREGGVPWLASLDSLGSFLDARRELAMVCWLALWPSWLS